MLKVFLSLVVICLVYILAIFLAPETTSTIETMVGFSGTTQKVQNFKTGFDETITNIPSVDEFKSGALDIGTSIKDGLDTAKSSIDDVRVTLSGAQDVLDSTMDTIENVSDTVTDLRDSDATLEKFGNSLQGTVNTTDVGNATNN